MNRVYDGLKVVRIPITNADIFTSSSCIKNVQWLEVGNVCVSETVEAACQDTEHAMNEEYVTPSDPGFGAVC